MKVKKPVLDDYLKLIEKLDNSTPDYKDCLPLIKSVMEHYGSSVDFGLIMVYNAGVLEGIKQERKSRKEEQEGLKMKGMLNITDVINMTVEDYDKETCFIIEKSPQYKKELSEYQGIINQLDRDTMLKIDEKVISLQTTAQDIAFNQGFKFAVRLLMSSMT